VAVNVNNRACGCKRKHIIPQVKPEEDSEGDADPDATLEGACFREVLLLGFLGTSDGTYSLRDDTGFVPLVQPSIVKLKNDIKFSVKSLTEILDSKFKERSLYSIPYASQSRKLYEVPFGRDSGEVPRGEKMPYSGTDPESYITEYTLVYEEQNIQSIMLIWRRVGRQVAGEMNTRLAKLFKDIILLPAFSILVSPPPPRFIAGGAVGGGSGGGGDGGGCASRDRPDRTLPHICLQVLRPPKLSHTRPVSLAWLPTRPLFYRRSPPSFVMPRPELSRRSL